MDADVLLRFFMALIFTLSLIGLLYWLVRRYAPSRMLTPLGKGNRLRVLEVRPLDSRRRLILIRRDKTEHLLLLGAQGDLVIESEIKTPNGGRSSISFQDQVTGSSSTDAGDGP